MTSSIGVDTIQIKRFIPWQTFENKKLLRIFSQEEILYAHQNSIFFAQRLAVRFAAKEAFLKALQQLFPQKTFSLLKIAKLVHVSKKKSGMPFLLINWNNLLAQSNTKIISSISLSHTTCCATAIVQLNKNHS